MPEKPWRVEFSRIALKSLKKIDKKASHKILSQLEKLEENINPLLHKDIRPLSGKLGGFYRLRIGDFRIIFELDTKNSRIEVHLIVSRDKAY